MDLNRAPASIEVIGVGNGSGKIVCKMAVRPPRVVQYLACDPYWECIPRTFIERQGGDHLVIITDGLGGPSGTGESPIIARVVKDGGTHCSGTQVQSSGLPISK